MGQKISEMTDVGAGALSTDQLELARSSSSSSFRIALSALATFIKAYVGPLVGTTLTITGVAALSAGLTVTGGTTAVQALTATTFDATGAVTTTGANAANHTSAAVIDFLGGAARFQSYGADASTNGTFSLISRRSDGSNAVTVATISGAGTVVFTAGLTATSATLSGGNALVFSTAQARIIPGATDIAFNNNANTFNNLLITDAGNVTIRGTLQVSAATGLALGAVSGVQRISWDGTSFNFVNASNALGPIIASLTTAVNHVSNGAAVSGGAGTVSYGGTVASSVGAAGGASALPATPLGYIIINVAGTQAKIPYYNN